MRFSDVREARREMLGRAHIQPLVRYVERLRRAFGIEVPDFDPVDGGVNARVLFLMEKPGPMTSGDRAGRAGSGFISRDNDDLSAEATFRFMEAAGIPRTEAVLWNVIPGWNGTRRITPDELRKGVAEVENLLELLGQVQSIVLVGRKAQRAEPLLARTGLRLFRSAHPSPIVRASRPEKWAAIPAAWREAYAGAR